MQEKSEEEGLFYNMKNIKTKYNINTPSLNEILETKGQVEGFGHVSRVAVKQTRNGDDMEFINIDDEDGSISLALMPNIYEQFKDYVHEGDYITFKGNHDREGSINVKGLKVLKDDKNSNS